MTAGVTKCGKVKIYYAYLKTFNHSLSVKFHKSACEKQRKSFFYWFGFQFCSTVVSSKDDSVVE